MRFKRKAVKNDARFSSRPTVLDADATRASGALCGSDDANIEESMHLSHRPVGRRADALARQRGNQGQPGIVHGRSVGREPDRGFPQKGARTRAFLNLGDASRARAAPPRPLRECYPSHSHRTGLRPRFASHGSRQTTTAATRVSIRRSCAPARRTGESSFLRSARRSPSRPRRSLGSPKETVLRYRHFSVVMHQDSALRHLQRGQRRLQGSLRARPTEGSLARSIRGSLPRCRWESPSTRTTPSIVAT